MIEEPLEIFSGSPGMRNEVKPKSFKEILYHSKNEASYFDRINMTENRLEYDRKMITPTNMNDGT